MCESKEARWYGRKQEEPKRVELKLYAKQQCPGIPSAEHLWVWYKAFILHLPSHAHGALVPLEFLCLSLSIRWESVVSGGKQQCAMSKVVPGGSGSVTNRMFKSTGDTPSENSQVF